MVIDATFAVTKRKAEKVQADIFRIHFSAKVRKNNDFEKLRK